MFGEMIERWCSGVDSFADVVAVHHHCALVERTLRNERLLMIIIGKIAQIGSAPWILNVWFNRFDKDTGYRGRDAKKHARGVRGVRSLRENYVRSGDSEGRPRQRDAGRTLRAQDCSTSFHRSCGADARRHWNACQGQGSDPYLSLKRERSHNRDIKDSDPIFEGKTPVVHSVQSTLERKKRKYRFNRNSPFAHRAKQPSPEQA